MNFNTEYVEPGYKLIFNADIIPIEEYNQNIDIRKSVQDISIITLNYLRLVSSDFIGTTTPTIIDENSIMQLTSKKIKFGVWYDNEWSYSSQIIKLMKHIFKDNLRD